MSEEEDNEAEYPPYRKDIDDYEDKLKKELWAVVYRFRDQYEPHRYMEEGVVKDFSDGIKEDWVFSQYDYEVIDGIELDDDDDVENI